MRILLSNKSRKELFEDLMLRNESNSLRELSIKFKIPFKTIRNWRYNYKKYIPENLIKYCKINLEILDKQQNSWGQIKGGKKGIEKKIENLKKLWRNPKYREMRKRIGKIAVENLKANSEKYIEQSNKTKLNKRKEISKNLELQNSSFFINQKILLDNSKIIFNQFDKKKNLKLPNEITPELSEEIGVHLGDGCLSLNRKYFSVKTNKKEKDYMVNFLFPLYKKLYNLDLKLMELESVVGFEIYSNAFFEFKNKVLNIPYGNKVEKIEIPKYILESKDKDIYCACIRGLFDTDGCVSIIKRNRKKYSTITFTIKSQKLIKQVGEMLSKLGFIPYIGKWKIDLNGIVMLNKWIKEINSNNPKNLAKLQQARSITG